MVDLNKKETAEEFVHWLLGACEDIGQRAELSLTEIYGRAMNVELGESVRVTAISEHEKYQSLIEAGFTEAQAFRYVLNDRTSMFSAAIKYHRPTPRDDGDTKEGR